MQGMEKARQMKFLHNLCMSAAMLIAINGCKSESCSDDPNIICRDEKMYICVPNDTPGWSDPKSEYTLLIDCPKFGAVCDSGTPGYIPIYIHSPMVESDSFACVVPDHECDSDMNSDEDTDCYDGAQVSCLPSSGIAVIRNTTDNDPHLICP